METYNQNDKKKSSLNMNFVQDNQSMSTKGVLRGLHLKKLYSQGKLIRAICETMKKVTEMNNWIPSVNGEFLMFVAKIVGPLGGKAVGIHPARVKKLMISTNINGDKLKYSGYKFHWTLEESLIDWFEDCGSKRRG